MRSTQFYLLVGSLLAASTGIAQTAAPGSAPAASSTSGMGWLWIVVLVVAVGGAIWYFFHQKQAVGDLFHGCGSRPRSWVSRVREGLC